MVGETPTFYNFEISLFGSWMSPAYFNVAGLEEEHRVGMKGS